MKLPRASMMTTSFAALVLAVDFAVARELLRRDSEDLSFPGLGLLPMATALAFGLYRLARLRTRAGAFTVGFVAVGLAASVGSLAADLLVPGVEDALGEAFGSMAGRLARVLPPGWVELDDVATAPECLLCMAIFSIPSGLLALAGGRVARRLASRREVASPRRKRPRARRKPRFTLASASLLVAVLAVDLGLIHHLAQAVEPGPVHDRPIGDRGPWLGFITPWGLAILNRWSLFAAGLLPMANLLFLGLPGALRARRRPGSFRLGFEVVGWLATVASLAACAVAPGSVMGAYGRFGLAVEGAIDLAFGGGQAQRFWTNSSYASLAAAAALSVAFFTLPPLVAALSGGAIIRRLGRGATRAA